MSTLTHFNSSGAAHMVDIGDKPVTRRIAKAEGRIVMQAATLALIVEGAHRKGDVLAMARIAGIMAAKKTAELIPLCHPLALSRMEIDLQAEPERSAVYCCVVAETCAQTGVEMEALTAVQISLLTIYDMCKAADRSMILTDIRLVEKSGGKSGDWQRPADAQSYLPYSSGSASSEE